MAAAPIPTTQCPQCMLFKAHRLGVWDDNINTVTWVATWDFSRCRVCKGTAKTCVECKADYPIVDNDDVEGYWRSPEGVESAVCIDCTYSECKGCSTLRVKADVAAGLPCGECLEMLALDTPIQQLPLPIYQGLPLPVA